MHHDQKELSIQEKAIRRLASIDIQAHDVRGSVYVHVGYDVHLEISDHEIEFQAEQYDEEQKELWGTDGLWEENEKAN